MKTMFWAYPLGYFVRKTNGLHVLGTFTGIQAEWNETLVETCIDVYNTINKEIKNSLELYVSPKIFNLLRSTILFKSISDTSGHITNMKIISLGGEVDNEISFYQPGGIEKLGRVIILGDI